MIGHAFKTLLSYLRAPARRTAEEFGDAIEEEIAFHVAERTREYVAQGLPEDEAKRQALARFGDASRVAAECHTASISGLVVWHRFHLAATAALTVAVALLWFKAFGPSHDGRLSLSQLPPGIASMLDNDWTGDIAGRILDERQQPLADAHVLVVVKTWPDGSYFQRAYSAVSDIDGRFRIDDVHPVNERFEVQIAAIAENRVLKSSYHSRTLGTLEPVVLELPPSSAFMLQVESNTGAALSGIEVLPHRRIETSGARHLVYFDSAQALRRQTDGAGRVLLSYFQPGEKGTVLIRTSPEDWESRDFTVPRAGETVTIHVTLKTENEAEET